MRCSTIRSRCSTTESEIVVPSRLALAVVLPALVAACAADKGPPTFVGSLEWDRIAVLAELREPVLSWAVAEGDRVAAGDVLLELDASRQDARIAELRGNLALAEARLAELTYGARIETIAAARATLARARSAQTDAEIGYERAAELLRRGLTSQAAFDQALAARDVRRAETAAAGAELTELTAGTRPEQIDQGAAAVDAAKAALREAELTRERLTVRAPRAGVVDALPFHPGDQPPLGAELVSLLVGEAPYARVFVPAPYRAAVEPGDVFEIRVQGVDAALRGTVRSIRSEPNFTPYYALAGNDASRLVYQAEIVLEPAATELPAGLPLTATRLGDGDE
jgi:HlyD family secretion protein